MRLEMKSEPARFRSPYKTGKRSEDEREGRGNGRWETSPTERSAT